MIAALTDLLDARMAGLALAPGEALVRDAPGGLSTPGLTSANRQCRLLRCGDGWAALNLARADDLELIPAFAGADGEPWRAVEKFAAASSAADFRARAILFQLPVALPAEAAPLVLANTPPRGVPRRVVDLSALWAGPLCAGLLARAGADVVRIESLGRPDPTPRSSPLLDARINAGKRRLPLDLRTAEGRAALAAELDAADVLVTSARPAACARLGITAARFPDLTWVAITAHGFSEPAAQRVGFGDDCAVAGGLLRDAGDEPRMIGDALADPLTGIEAARAVLGGQRGLIDMAMARVAAAYAGMLAR